MPGTMPQEPTAIEWDEEQHITHPVVGSGEGIHADAEASDNDEERVDIGESKSYPKLLAIENELHAYSQIPVTTLAEPLVFMKDPKDHGTFVKKLYLWHQGANQGIHMLHPNATINVPILRREIRLRELFSETNILPGGTQREGVENVLWEQMATLESQKELHWNRQRLSLSGKIVVNTGMREPHRDNPSSLNFPTRCVLCNTDG